MAMLGEVAVAYQLVLTKVDQVRPGALAELIESLRTDLARKPGAHPEIIATSARDGIGIEGLRAALAALAIPPCEARR
jgi:GTP-binding protein